MTLQKILPYDPAVRLPACISEPFSPEVFSPQAVDMIVGKMRW